jgi:hypothetical protein
MRVGLDFDNTIVSYDTLFHKVAREGGWIPADLPASKLLVRDRLREIGKEDVWTEMQGTVYGSRMAEAAMFPGVLEFMRWARNADIALAIVSHKTRHPFIGPKHDLHAAARGWIEQWLCDAGGALVDPGSVYFELTKEEKCARLGAIGCDCFVDDLPELLTSASFPKQVEPVLFDPEGHHAGLGLPTVKSWSELQQKVASRWQPAR